MRGISPIIVLFLLAVIACFVFGIGAASRVENVALHTVDSYLAYQQQPGVILERQLADVQASSPSNAPGFPWPLLLALVGLVLLVSARYYQDILNARTAYLKERKKAQNHRNTVSRPPLRTIAPIQPLNPYGFQPAPNRPALPSPSADEQGDGERW